MEFQEAVTAMRRPTDRGPPRFRWKFSFHRRTKSNLSSPSLSSSSTASSPRRSVSVKPQQPKQSDFPAEFICPVSGSLMVDPVIVASGHSFDRASVEACKSVGFVPTLEDGATPDFSAVIPNLALKSTILSHCKGRSLPPPESLSLSSVEKIVRELMASKAEARDSSYSVDAREEKNTPAVTKTDFCVSKERITPAVTEREFFRESATQSDSSSDESAGTATTTTTSSSSAIAVAATTNQSTPPPQLVTRPSCWSSPCSSSEADIGDSEEDDLISKLKSEQIFEIEEAALRLRSITRWREDIRVSLCNDRLLSAVRPLIISKYSGIQVNLVAAVVNLSLEKVNKVKIMRSGILPNLIIALKAGSPEAQEHAAGALFSLALDDHNKIAIGVLGALPPLVNMLRSTSERARTDSAMALYHLTLVQSNCIKLIRFGSVQVFLGMLKSGQMVNLILLIMCNLGSYPDGRTALLDSGAMECLLSLLDRVELKSNSARDNCLNALIGLSRVGLRFKGLAKARGAMNILKKVEIDAPSNKARFLMDVIEERCLEDEEEEVDWEKLLESGPPSPRPDGPAR